MKAKVLDLDFARIRLGELEATFLGTLRQVDTYFAAPNGRLKLREINGVSAELIWYDRPQKAGERISRYQRVAVDCPKQLAATLAAACGLAGIVEKSRDAYLLWDTRIHLDQVEGLGAYIEFEALLERQTLQEAKTRIDRLTKELRIDPGATLAGSYRDLLRERGDHGH